MTLENIEKVMISNLIIKTTLEFFQDSGVEEKEAILLWVGELNNKEFIVKKVIFPEQVCNEYLYFVFEPELDRINRELFEKKYRLIAQLHSHKNNAFHSEIDDEYPIMTTLGGFSIVVPNFGFLINDFFIDCAIFKLTIDGWDEFDHNRIKKYFSVTNAREN